MVLEVTEFNGYYLFRTEADCCCLEPVFDEGAHTHDWLTFMNDLSHISCFGLYYLSEEAYTVLLRQYDETGTIRLSELHLTPQLTVPYSSFNGIEDLMEEEAD